jgi:hypothetical protein
LPGADPQRRQEIPSVAIGDPLDDEAGVRMSGGDRGAGENPAGRIADHPGDFTRVGLRGGAAGERRQHGAGDDGR